MSKTKQCKDCYKVKPIEQFALHSEMRDGRRNDCIDCKNARNVEWRKRNKDKSRQYRIDYDLKVKNGERPHRYQAKKLRIRNSCIVRDICTDKMLKQKLRVRESTFLRWFGCSSKTFVTRFERYFEKNPGMGWHNYGAWQMDHIKPMKEFTLDTETSRKLCNHYTNLRPEWALNNMKKSSKYEVEQTI